MFLAGGDLPDEHVRVAGVFEGDFARAKGVVETMYAALKGEPEFERASDPLFHPGKAAKTGAGTFGVLHPTLLEGTWGGFELDLEQLLEASREPVAYEDVITYPPLRQDLAFSVPEDVSAGDLVAAAHEAAGPELREMSVVRRLPRRPGRRGPQVDRVRRQLPVVGANALGRGRGRAAREDRRGAREAVRRRAQSVVGASRSANATITFRWISGEPSRIRRKLRSVIDQGANGRGRRDRRRARRMVHERDLAEEVAGSERIHLLTVLEHVRRALDEDEELATRRTLASQLLPLLEVDLVCDPADQSQLLLRAFGEQRRPLEELGFRVLTESHAGESKASERVGRSW